MRKSGFLEIFRSIFRNIEIERFLTSKDLLIFLFFLCVSTGLWVLHALHKDYETVITIPVEYKNLPSGYVQKNPLPNTIRVTVNDYGTTLVRYRWLSSFNPIMIDAAQYVNKNHVIETSQFESSIQKQLNTSTKILRLSPIKIDLEFERLHKKEVKVNLNAKISIAQQYIQCGDVELIPNHVTAYSTQQRLDSILEIATQAVDLTDIKDTVDIVLNVDTLENVSIKPNKVRCIIKTEPFTEKTIEVPIKALNVPTNYHLRMFPSTAKVILHVGMSQYDKISPRDFKVTADYNKADDNRLTLQLDNKCELNIKNLRVEPKDVEFIAEKAENKAE